MTELQVSVFVPAITVSETSDWTLSAESERLGLETFSDVGQEPVKGMSQGPKSRRFEAVVDESGHVQGSPVVPVGLRTQTVGEWLESPYLARVASRVASHYEVPYPEAADLLQELRLALWKAGPGLMVNVTWVFHTANHKAIDFVKRRIRLAEETLSSSEDLSSPPGVDPALPRLLRARSGLLPKRLHAFYLLRYEEGLSQREIAKRLGLCRGSVRCLDRRCLRMMKGRLAS